MNERHTRLVNDGRSPEVEGCLAEVLSLPVHPHPGAGHHLDLEDPALEQRGEVRGDEDGLAGNCQRRCRPCVPLGRGGSKVRWMGMRMVPRMMMRWMVRMRMASRCLKESESQAGGKNQEQLWPFPPTGNFGTKDTFVASPIPQLIFHWCTDGEDVW